jgi:hypothetical protein
MTESLAARTTANQVARGKAALARDAEDISAALARFAKDVETGLDTGAAQRIAQDVQQFLLSASRIAAVRETAALYDAETEASAGQS